MCFNKSNFLTILFSKHQILRIYLHLESNHFSLNSTKIKYTIKKQRLE